MQNERLINGTEQALLSEVQAALKRIEAGTYGKCIVCGKEIPEKRLEALPWASRCITDEAEWEAANADREEAYEQTDTPIV